MPNKTIDQINRSAEYILSCRPTTNWQPLAGIILGTGLSGLSNSIEEAIHIPYENIPGFPVSTVESHKGELIIGKLNGVGVVAMAGRIHYYEGYSMKEVTFPVRVLKMLGIERLIISNASGGVSEKVKTGDLAVITDHINLFPENPLRGKNIDSLGPRFPDMVKAYDGEMIKMAKVLGHESGTDLKEVVYVGVAGPNLETKAEFQYFKTIGADVVGMSTIPEVIVARHMDLPVLAFSVVTNEGLSKDREASTVEEIIEVSREAAKRLEPIVCRVLQSIYDQPVED